MREERGTSFRVEQRTEAQEIGRDPAISNARTSRFAGPLGNARASRMNFAAVRPDESASAPTVEDGTGTASATPSPRWPCDRIAPDSPRHQRRMRRRGTAPPPAWVSEAPRPEPPGTDRPGGGAADRSSVVGAAARASPRTR